ncbi:hypothetical protein AEM51_03655 [Bacteroidetes bacterium UKL13-3]|nr:hypothetical protein AEM51_03655 [Bacteroidetes bacterium UKL13-3]HCP94716.1 hypothetical protein [Bacteroidota bacterium]
MKRNKTVLGLVITDGVGFRNFILSDFIREAKEKFDEVIIFSCLPNSAYSGHSINCRIKEIPIFKEHFVTWIFRKTKEIAHLKKYASNNYGIRDNLKINYNNAKTLRGFFTRAIFKITDWFHSEKNILFIEKLQELSFRFHKNNSLFDKLLEENPVDILFFTHQRPPFIAPIIASAKRKKIKTASFIFSWDNLASKGRMAGLFDYYLVWSELMKKELIYFYESVDKDNIFIVGTPQFEPYILERYIESKDSFSKRFKIKTDIPTVLFTCNDSSSENDPIYAEILAEQIKSKKVIANLIIRTSPAEEPDRFMHLKNKYPFIIWNFPEWKLTRAEHPEPWTQRVPTTNDILTLRSLLAYSDVVINVLSTISLDAFIFEKPVINPVFGNNENELFNDQHFLKYKHLTHLVESNSSYIVHNQSELTRAIEDCLQNPRIKNEARKAFIRLEIGGEINGTSNRIAQTLHSIVS